MGHNEIKAFYKQKEFGRLLKETAEKGLTPDDPLKNRAYLIIKALPDAKVGTVLRPAIDDNGELTTKPEYKNQYNYASKYVGRNTFLHREIVENEEKWFVRIN